MALAKKCDICGKFYEHYGKNSKSAIDSNMLRFAYNYENASNVYTNEAFDCCPACLNSILDLINKLKNPEGPVKLGDLLGNTEDDID